MTVNSIVIVLVTLHFSYLFYLHNCVTVNLVFCFMAADGLGDKLFAKTLNTHNMKSQNIVLIQSNKLYLYYT